MNTPHYAAAAAKLLGRRIGARRLSPDDRERGIATIERAMLSRARRRRAVGALGLLAAAAALVLAVQGVRRLGAPAPASPVVAINVSPAGRGAELRAGDHAEPLSTRALLAPGQRIETPVDGGASLRLSTGTSMDLSGSTAFRVDSQGALERFSLERGELSAHVAKLKPGQRFIVATPDAEVEVRGTRFRVHVVDKAQACGEGSRTRLEVSEGAVEVRGASVSVMVKAGQRWPADCVADAPTAEAPASTESSDLPGAGLPAPSPKHVTGRGADAPKTPPSGPERASVLAQQTDLFAGGVALRRQGDVSGALRAYQDLILRFPKSPLVENAMAERMRVLAMSGDGRARSEARRYLARFPRGFAANEAKRLTAEP